nr:hypothetical protein [Neosynechococcus sphagnicola]
MASQYEVHPTMINNWKRQVLEEASSLFEKGSEANQANESQQSQIDQRKRRSHGFKAQLTRGLNNTETFERILRSQGQYRQTYIHKLFNAGAQLRSRDLMA